MTARLDSAPVDLSPEKGALMKDALQWVEPRVQVSVQANDTLITMGAQCREGSAHTHTHTAGRAAQFA